MSDHQSSLGRSGQEFIKSLFYLFNNARIYQDNNQLINRCVLQLKGILDELTREDDVSIDLWRGRFHVRGEKLSYRRDIANVINSMVEYFTNRKISRINFFQASRDASPANLLAFTRLLNNSVRSDDPPGWLEKILREYGFLND